MNIVAADLFCGAGGTSLGLLLAARALGINVDLLAINHWNIAVESHALNHPGVRHLCESLDTVDPRKVIPSGKLDILLASPECTHFSGARGGKPMSDQSRATAWHIPRWLEALDVDNVLIENVRSWRHIIEQRAHPAAEVQIRALAVALYRCLVAMEPRLFGDYELVDLPDGTTGLQTKWRKV